MTAVKRKQEPVRPSTPATPAAAPSSGWLWALAAAVIGLAIYWPAIEGPFVFDDEYLFFRDPVALERLFDNLSLFGRPLVNISYWLNAKLFGDGPFSFHLVGVLLHLANCGLLFLALRRLLAEAAVEQGPMWAGFLAAVFLVHPVHTESVAYISGRSEPLSLLFVLSAFWLFLRAHGDGVGWGAALAIGTLFGAAFLSKEHAVALAALLLWTDLWFSRGTPLEALRRNWRLYVPLAVVGLAGSALVLRTLQTARTAGFGMKDLPWYAYFYTQWRSLWVYLATFAAPVNLNADYWFPLSFTPWQHGAALGLAGLIAITAAAFLYRRRFPLAFYGWIAFLLLIAPTSSVVPIKDPVAERRLYMPFLGLLLVAGDVLRRWRPSRQVQLAAMGVILVALAALTYARAALWGDPIALWRDTAAKNPQSFRAQFQLAMAHYSAGQCDAALPVFERAATMQPRDHGLLVDWGLAYDCLNRHEEALGKFRAAAQADDTGHARALIGMALAKLNKPGAALDELNAAISRDPKYDMSYVYRGNVYLMMQDLDRAEADYRKALTLAPQSSGAQRGIESVARQRSGSR